jgi:hypothetical protein
MELSVANPLDPQFALEGAVTVFGTSNFAVVQVSWPLASFVFGVDCGRNCYCMTLC